MPVHLFVDRPADVADPQLLRTGSEREPERVAQTGGDDPPLVGVVARTQRIAGGRRPGVWVESQHRAAQPDRITGSAQILRHGEGAALLGRVAARVSPLSVVDDLMMRAFAHAEVQHAVRGRTSATPSMTRELLAPVVDQHVLWPSPGSRFGCRRERRPVHDAAVLHGTRRIGATVSRLPGRTPTRRGTTNCRVEHVPRRIRTDEGREAVGRS